MSSFLAMDLARGSSENQASPSSLLFLGIPLLRGICCWGDGASTVLAPYANPSSLGSTWYDMIISVGKVTTPLVSLGIPDAGEKDPQSFWGLDLVILRLRAPFLILWDISMAQLVCILHAVYLKNVEGGKIDQIGLVRENANRVQAWFHN
jgi:hypothetical protein